MSRHTGLRLTVADTGAYGVADIAVINADLTQVLPRVLSLPIATLICDAPYSAKVHDNAVSNNNAAQGPGTHKRGLGFGPLTPELRAAIAQVAQHATRWSLIYSDLESGHEWRAAVVTQQTEYLRTVPWIRWSQPQKSGDRPPSGAELVTVFARRGRKHWSGPGSLTAFETRDEPCVASHFDAKSLRGDDKYSCEKPLDLLLQQVSWFSDPGELVCDPCCGVGTTGLAARMLGRDALLLDASAEACMIARTRLAASLSPRDAERTRRFVESQRKWLVAGAPNTAAGQARYARARADTEKAVAWL